jgi:hypothetical protein
MRKQLNGNGHAGNGHAAPSSEDRTSFYVEQINARWQSCVTSIIDVGRLLLRAKDELGYGTFHNMVEHRMPFGKRTAQMLMCIAEHPIIANQANHGSLPPSWRTLYELTTLPTETLQTMLADGRLNPHLERKDVAHIRKTVTLNGVFLWPNLNIALNTVLTVMQLWPEPKALAEALPFLNNTDPPVALDQLAKLAPWITQLHAQWANYKPPPVPVPPDVTSERDVRNWLGKQRTEQARRAHAAIKLTSVRPALN